MHVRHVFLPIRSTILIVEVTLQLCFTIAFTKLRSYLPRSVVSITSSGEVVDLK